MQVRTFGRAGWPVSEIGYGMWGMGGWTGSDDDESLRVARPRGRARLHLLRHRLGLRQGQSEQLLGRALDGASRHAARSSRPRFRRRTCEWPGAPSTPLDDVSRPTTSASITEKSLANLGLDAHRPAAVPRVERRVGRRRPAGSARSTTLKREGWSAHSASASTAGSRRTCSRALDTGLVDACRSSTTSSTRRRRTSCSRCAASRTSRSSRACRSTKAASPAR